MFNSVPGGHSKPPSWISVSDTVFLASLFLVLAKRNYLLEGGETNWHILTGNIVLHGHHVPRIDPYSYTTTGLPWNAPEWLSDLVFALVHRLMGFNGLVVLTGTIIALTLFTLYKFLVRRGANPFSSILVVMLAGWSFNILAFVKPHIFSFLLSLIFFIILEMYQRERKNYLRWLPLLMILWVNLHSGFIVGIILMVIYSGCNLVIYLYDRRTNQASLASSKALAGITLLTLLSTLVNPGGLRILLVPFRLIGDSYLMDHIIERASPNLHDFPQCGILLLVFVVALALSPNRPDIFEVVTFLVFGFFALYSMKDFPTFSILAASPAAIHLDNVIGHYTRRLPLERIKRVIANLSEAAGLIERSGSRHAPVYAALGILVVIGTYGNRTGIIKLTDRDRERYAFPVDALNFAIGNEIGGNMFNDEQWGGYILLNSYPRYRVFMDGRTEMYEADLLRKYYKVVNVEYGFETVLNDYNVDWVIYRANSPLCQLLNSTGRWRLVYADGVANILVRNTPDYKQLIQRYAGSTRFIPEGYIRATEWSMDSQ
jgi:hypothetical protein